MCHCLRIHPSGFYAWLKEALSKRAKEDVRQTALLKQAWQDSGKVYGDHKLHHDPEASMSRHGNSPWKRSFRRRAKACHDNAEAERFFQLLKRERIRRETYATREDARADVFEYIEMF